MGSFVKIATWLLGFVLGLTLIAAAAWAQTGGYTSPPRGVPDCRLSGASRDLIEESRVALVSGNAH